MSPAPRSPRHARRILVVGDSALGRSLADGLDRAGHSVGVVGDGETVAALGVAFRGERVRGESVDLDSLERAGIREAGCVFAVTERDHRNLVVASRLLESVDGAPAPPPPFP